MSVVTNDPQIMDGKEAWWMDVSIFFYTFLSPTNESVYIERSLK